MGRVLNYYDFRRIRKALDNGNADTVAYVRKVAKVTGWGLRTVQRVKSVNTYAAYKTLLLGELYTQKVAQGKQHDVLTPIIPFSASRDRSGVAVGVLMAIVALMAIAVGVVIGYVL